MQQFGRNYRLEIGNNKESISFNNLRVSFNISKTITAEPNAAEISIYNLNQTHRALIVSRQYRYVNLYVSYVSEDLRLIFSGYIVKAQNRRHELDFITVLKCQDGYEAFTNSVSAKTLSAGVSDLDVVNHSLQQMQLEKGSITLPCDRRLPRGKVMMCDTREALHNVAKNNNADWSIQDNQLMILPRDSAIKGDGFILSQETGLIGAPQKTDKGVELETLCNPYFKIGSLVRVKSILEEYNDDYKIISITHSGDIYDNNWKTRLVCYGGKFNLIAQH